MPKEVKEKLTPSLKASPYSAVSSPVGYEPEQPTSLHKLAATNNSLAMSRVLFAHNDSCIRSLLKTDSKQRTPLHFASAHGHADCVRLILHCAEQANDSDSLKRLLGMRDVRGNSPLFLAVSGGHVQVAQMLVQKGADVTCHGGDGRSLVDIIGGRLRGWGSRPLLNVGVNTKGSVISAIDNMHLLLDILNGHMRLRGKDGEVDSVDTIVKRLEELSSVGSEKGGNNFADAVKDIGSLLEAIRL